MIKIQYSRISRKGQSKRQKTDKKYILEKYYIHVLNISKILIKNKNNLKIFYY